MLRIIVTTHVLVCFASGLPWIPCPPSTVDPFLHRASPAPTPQTVRRITWLWWVPIAGGKMGRAHCVLCFNDSLVCTLCVLTVLCVSETSCLPPLAEPSVYLPSRKWHQQPGPEDMWQCGLPCTGLSAGVTEPTQKSKQILFLTYRIWNGVCSYLYHSAAFLKAWILCLPHSHSPPHLLWPLMRRSTMCKWTRRRLKHCKAPCRSGPMCGSLLNLLRESSPDTDLLKTKYDQKQNNNK